MNTTLKKWGMGLLILGAVICASYAAIDVGFAKTDAAQCLAEDDQNCYVLRDYEGYVAVFVETDPYCPMTVTEIQVSTLRELDRMLLQTGMKVRSHEKLMMTLEDLGS